MYEHYARTQNIHAKATMTRQLILYVRSDCHLCEEMGQALVDWRERLRFDVELIDIESDPQLFERYQYKVPVLVERDEEICHFFLDEEMLIAHFEHVRR